MTTQQLSDLLRRYGRAKQHEAHAQSRMHASSTSALQAARAVEWTAAKRRTRLLKSELLAGLKVAKSTSS